eukprot:372957-Rhodomonas_salina.1
MSGTDIRDAVLPASNATWMILEGLFRSAPLSTYAMSATGIGRSSRYALTRCPAATRGPGTEIVYGARGVTSLLPYARATRCPLLTGYGATRLQQNNVSAAEVISAIRLRAPYAVSGTLLAHVLRWRMAVAMSGTELAYRGSRLSQASYSVPTNSLPRTTD